MGNDACQRVPGRRLVGRGFHPLSLSGPRRADGPAQCWSRRARPAGLETDELDQADESAACRAEDMAAALEIVAAGGRTGGSDACWSIRTDYRGDVHRRGDLCERL